MNMICESCEVNPAVVKPNSHTIPDSFQLCSGCRTRLDNRALRPLEYFRLAAIHGPAHDLHDDFYDDAGDAVQPLVEVDRPGDLPFPTLAAIQNDLELLVDFACVGYVISPETIDRLLQLDKDKLLNYLQYKVNYNRAINFKCYEIAAKVLPEQASKWIQTQWENRHSNELNIFAEALAACLPATEAFQLIESELEAITGSLLAEQCIAFAYLHTPKTLEWIAYNRAKIINVYHNWGVLAAVSQFDLQTAKSWLEIGRPLSLIALDALQHCTSSIVLEKQAIWQMPLGKLCIFRSDAVAIGNLVTEYLDRDDVARTRSTVKQINWNLFGDSNNAIK